MTGWISCTGRGGWHPDLVDRDNDDYYGDAVPSGVRNLKHDPILVPIAAALRAQARAQRAAPDLIAPFVHEVLEFPSPGNRKIRR